MSQLPKQQPKYNSQDNDSDDDSSLLDCGVDEDEIITRVNKTVVTTLKKGGDLIDKTVETGKKFGNQALKLVDGMYPTIIESKHGNTTTTSYIQDKKKSCVVVKSLLPLRSCRQSAKIVGCYENDVHLSWNGVLSDLKGENRLPQSITFQRSKMDFLCKLTGADMNNNGHKEILTGYLDDVMIGLISFRVTGVYNPTPVTFGIESSVLAPEQLYNDYYCTILAPPCPITHKTSQDCNLALNNPEENITAKMELRVFWDMQKAKDSVNTDRKNGVDTVIVNESHLLYRFLTAAKYLGLYNVEKYRSGPVYKMTREMLNSVCQSIEDSLACAPVVPEFVFELHSFGDNDMKNAVRADNPDVGPIEAVSLESQGFQVSVHCRATYKLFMKDTVTSLKKDLATAYPSDFSGRSRQ